MHTRTLASTDLHDPHSLERSSSTGLEQLASGTLEAFHTMWSLCWGDTTALACYTIMMMVMTDSYHNPHYIMSWTARSRVGGPDLEQQR